MNKMSSLLRWQRTVESAGREGGAKEPRWRGHGFLRLKWVLMAGDEEWGGGREEDAVPTVNQPLHVIVPRPQVGHLVYWSGCGGERPAPHTTDTGAAHLLLGSRFGFRRSRLAAGRMHITARSLRVWTATLFCLLLAFSTTRPACAGQSAPVCGAGDQGRAVVPTAPQRTAQNRTYCLDRHFNSLTNESRIKSCSLCSWTDENKSRHVATPRRGRCLSKGRGDYSCSQS